MGILIQVTVQLQNIIGSDRNILIIFMNGIQHITIPHNFFFITIAWRCLITDKLHQTCVCRADSLDLIGSLCTLYLCHFNQSVKFCRLLFQIKLLPSFIFMNLCHKSDDLIVPGTTCKFIIMEVSHILTLLSPNYSLF